MSDQKQTKENETMNAAQVLVRCLENEGVEYVFGIPGEENLEVMRALKDSKFFICQQLFKFIFSFLLKRLLLSQARRL